MDLRELRARLERLVETLTPDEQLVLQARLQGLVSVYPFNEYEFILMFLRDRNVITFDDYERLRSNYVSTNRYLELFSLSPRAFGQVWAEQHIMDLDSRFRKPDRTLDPEYDGEYDLWLDGVKVEIKSARAVRAGSTGEIVTRALRYGGDDPFWMNFQQLKPDACDVFIFVGVWADRIVYWVLSDDEVMTCKYLTHQHRGGAEYQIGITNRNLTEFERFRASPENLADVVLSSARR